MDKNLQRVRQGIRDVAGTWGLAIVILVFGFVFTYQFVGPPPPDRIVLATGQDGGAYQFYGEKLAAYLARQGIETELRATAGAAENLALLDSGDSVDLGFVQGGLAESTPTENVLAIGSLYLEPLWLFARADVELTGAGDLAGRRIAIGAEGSGTRAVVLNLLGAHGIGAQQAEFVGVSSGELVTAFANNAIDAAFLIGSPEVGAVAELIKQPGVTLHGLNRTAAYVRRFSYLSAVRLPQGVLDLQADQPRTDIDTVALTAMLAANKDLHPALIDLLLIAATDIHGEHGLLADAGQFPTPRFVDLPLSAEAERHFKNGPPLLMKYLPFWAATLIDRMVVMLIPLAALAFPLLKLFPPVYRWRVRSRIYRWYSDLRQIERRLDAGLRALAGRDRARASGRSAGLDRGLRRRGQDIAGRGDRWRQLRSILDPDREGPLS